MARAIVLAGGFGTRLARVDGDAPSVNGLPAGRPKALFPLGGVPILEIILHQLHDGGFDQVMLCLFWRADAIVEHFGDGSRLGLELEYSVTERTLGSAGPLAAVDPRGEPQLVLNCDLLTSLDFGSVLVAHRAAGPVATVVGRRHGSRLEYGMLELSEDGRQVRAHVEKPLVEHVICAGIYVLEPDVWRHLSAGVHLEMPTLLRRLIEEEAAVMPFLMEEEDSWIDIGRRDTYRTADEAFRHEPHRFLSGPSGRALLGRVNGSSVSPNPSGGSDGVAT